MDSEAFDFITPKQLRNNIIDSFEFVARFWLLALKIEPRYEDEMSRTIILYNISIIEALLLFSAKKRKIKFLELTYKIPTALPEQFQNSKEVLVLAYQSKTEKKENRVWLQDLIKEHKSFLGDSLHSDITDLQSIRNTFHLSANRSVLTLKRAEKSFDTVLKLFTKLQQET